MARGGPLRASTASEKRALGLGPERVQEAGAGAVDSGGDPSLVGGAAGRIDEDDVLESAASAGSALEDRVVGEGEASAAAAGQSADLGVTAAWQAIRRRRR